MSRERLPAIPRERMSDAQHEVAAEIAATRRGELSGPFVAALRSPEFTRRLQRLGEYLRYDCALPPRARELAILLTSRLWSQAFEWSVHVPIAFSVGVERELVARIGAGQDSPDLPPADGVVFDAVREIAETRGLSDRTYTAAVGAFGEAGLIDLLGIVGYYSTLAMIMNVARTPAPEADPQLLITTHRGTEAPRHS